MQTRIVITFLPIYLLFYGKIRINCSFYSIFVIIRLGRIDFSRHFKLAPELANLQVRREEVSGRIVRTCKEIRSNMGGKGRGRERRQKIGQGTRSGIKDEAMQYNQKNTTRLQAAWIFYSSLTSMSATDSSGSFLTNIKL